MEHKCAEATAPAEYGPLNVACNACGRHVTIVLPGTSRTLRLNEVKMFTTVNDQLGGEISLGETTLTASADANEALMWKVRAH